MNDSEYWPKWSERSHSTTILLAIVISARSRGVRGLYHAPAALFSRVHVSLFHLPSDLVLVCPCLGPPLRTLSCWNYAPRHLRKNADRRHPRKRAKSRMIFAILNPGEPIAGPIGFSCNGRHPRLTAPRRIPMNDAGGGGDTGHVRSSTCGTLAHYEARTIELVRRDDTIFFSNAFKPLGFWCTVNNWKKNAGNCTPCFCLDLFYEALGYG